MEIYAEFVRLHASKISETRQSEENLLQPWPRSLQIYGQTEKTGSSLRELISCDDNDGFLAYEAKPRNKIWYDNEAIKVIK